MFESWYTQNYTDYGVNLRTVPYVQLAQSFIKRKNMSLLSETNKFFETFLLSEYNECKFLINISSMKGNIIMGWYAEHMNEKQIRQERAPTIMNVSQLLLTGMAFNMGFTAEKQKTHQIMNSIKHLCNCMQYRSEPYLQCIVQFLNEKKKKKK
eukprot:202015_1